MIIDCHTHCYPDEVAAHPRRWAEARGEWHWADLVAPQDRKSIQDWADPGKFLAAMDQAGVDRAILLGWYWEQESTCRWHNEVIAEWVSWAPERFIGFASIKPNSQVIEQLEHALGLGLCGVGELHPGVQGFDSGSQAWGDMAAWCVAHDWPINCHATAEGGKDHPSSVPTPLNEYLCMAHSHPRLKLILAHWGGSLPLQSEVSLPDNLYYDCAASPLLYPNTIFREVVDRVGLDKILYGSDYPLRLFPRKQADADMTHYLHSIRTQTGLTPSELDAILGSNLERLLCNQS